MLKHSKSLSTNIHVWIRSGTTGCLFKFGKRVFLNPKIYLYIFIFFMNLRLTNKSTKILEKRLLIITIVTKY